MLVRRNEAIKLKYNTQLQSIISFKMILPTNYYALMTEE